MLLSSQSDGVRSAIHKVLRWRCISAREGPSGYAQLLYSHFLRGRVDGSPTMTIAMFFMAFLSIIATVILFITLFHNQAMSTRIFYSPCECMNTSSPVHSIIHLTVEFSAPIPGLRFHGLALALPLVKGSEVFWRVFLNRANHVPAETRIDYISYHWCALRLYQLCWITPNPRETIVTCSNQTRFLPTMFHSDDKS